MTLAKAFDDLVNNIKNLIGPQALGFMAAFEAGVITDDVMRMGKPLNEALASNWLTKSFTPFTEEFAKQKNLLQSGTLNESQRAYALDSMKFEKAFQEMERIENMKESQLLDVGGYGNLDGTSMYSGKQEEKDKKDWEKVGINKNTCFN